MFVDLTAIAGIVCGTSMISIVALSLARIFSRNRSGKEKEMILGMLERIDALETRLEIQDAEIKTLNEDNRYLNRLLRDDREDR